MTQGIIDADERLVEIDIVGELQLNLGAAARCARDDAFQARNRAQVLFLLDDDFFFDVLRRGSRPARRNRNGAHFQIGNHLDGDAHGRDDPQHAKHERSNGRQSAAFDQRLKHKPCLLLCMRKSTGQPDHLSFTQGLIAANDNPLAFFQTGADLHEAVERQADLDPALLHVICFTISF